MDLMPRVILCMISVKIPINKNMYIREMVLMEKSMSLRRGIKEKYLSCKEALWSSTMRWLYMILLLCLMLAINTYVIGRPHDSMEIGKLCLSNIGLSGVLIFVLVTLW